MTFTLATLTLSLAPAVVLIAVYILVRRQLAAIRRRLASLPAWTAELSVDRYQPMFRLLEEDDIRFLRSQPGATPTMIKRLRHRRHQVFRGYLTSLQRDFQQACEALMLVAVQSEADRNDLIRALVSRIKFSLGVFRVRCRLVLYRCDVGQESVARLVSLFENLQLELLALAPDATAV